MEVRLPTCGHPTAEWAHLAGARGHTELRWCTMKGEGKEQPQPEGQGAEPVEALNRGTEDINR
jgi:hypothetical protein